MMPRGEVALVVASAGLAEGLVDPGLYGALVAVVLIAALLTPILLRAAYRMQSTPPPEC